MDKIISYCDFYYIENEGKKYKPVSFALKVKDEIKKKIDLLNIIERCVPTTQSLHTNLTQLNRYQAGILTINALSGSHYDEQFVNSLPFRSDPEFFNWEVVLHSDNSVVDRNEISDIYHTDSIR